MQNPHHRNPEWYQEKGNTRPTSTYTFLPTGYKHASIQQAHLYLTTNWELLNVAVVISNEIHHLMGMLSKLLHFQRPGQEWLWHRFSPPENNPPELTTLEFRTLQQLSSQAMHGATSTMPPFAASNFSEVSPNKSLPLFIGPHLTPPGWRGGLIVCINPRLHCVPCIHRMCNLWLVESILWPISLHCHWYIGWIP